MAESCSHKAVVESSSLSISTEYNNMNKGLGSKILELYSKGYTRKQIVEELNCCKSVVSYHLSNKYKSIKKKDICECGRPKSIIAERCSVCENKLRRERLFNRTLQDIKDSTVNKNNPYHIVRAQARMLLQESGREPKCAICGFSEYVEACHIKAISSFPLDTKVREVNSLNNLVYLCPNHHILFDRGKLNKEDISCIGKLNS